MKNILVIFFTLFSFSVFSEEGRFGREANEYQYTSIGLSLISAEDDGIALNASLALPGPLYLVIERRADGIDVDSETYDKVMNAFRLGIHAGIGDILNSVSSKGVTFNIENFMDVYTEIGVKTTSLENSINNFSEDDAEANVIAGLRFGNSNDWEGKIFVDFSKETDVSLFQCPTGQVCTEEIKYVLKDETDRKFGAEAVFNIRKNTAVSFKVISSDVIDSSFEIGFRLTF